MQYLTRNSLIIQFKYYIALFFCNTTGVVLQSTVPRHIEVRLSCFSLNMLKFKIQRSTTQHSTMQGKASKSNTMQCNSTQQDSTQHSTTQWNTKEGRAGKQGQVNTCNVRQYSSAQHNPTQHNTTQHNNTVMTIHLDFYADLFYLSASTWSSHCKLVIRSALQNSHSEMLL